MNNVLSLGGRNLNTENWKVLHENGRHMFTCGEKKADWYLERNLAKITGDKEITFTFTPNGYGFEDNEEFGRSVREAKCVVDGVTDDLQRHHIVPYCYRSYFPEEFKSKNHHDVVLINCSLHAKYELVANVFKDEIATIYDVKTINELNEEYITSLREIGKDNSILINAVHGLFFGYGRLSQDQIIERLQFISKNSNIPFELLKTFNYVQLYKIYLELKNKRIEQVKNFKSKYRKIYDHGFHVAQKLDTDTKIEEFIKLWRNHFIDTMHPKYMPIGWSVDFRVKTKM